MKKMMLFTALVLAFSAASSIALADDVTSQCNVSVKGVSVAKFVVEDGVGQGLVDDLQITVMLNDPSGVSAQVAFYQKSTDVTAIFYQATSAPGSFKDAATYGHGSTNYMLSCTALQTPKAN